MQIKNCFTVSWLLYCCWALLGGADAAFSQHDEVVPYKVIRLLADEIVPSVALIELGTVIIWVNQDSQAAEIHFTDTSGLDISCDGSEDFIANPEQAVFANIPRAGVESLCLIRKGEFNYLVQRGLRALSGTIIVR